MSSKNVELDVELWLILRARNMLPTAINASAIPTHSKNETFSPNKNMPARKLATIMLDDTIDWVVANSLICRRKNQIVNDAVFNASARTKR